MDWTTFFVSISASVIVASTSVATTWLGFRHNMQQLHWEQTRAEQQQIRSAAEALLESLEELRDGFTRNPSGHPQSALSAPAQLVTRTARAARRIPDFDFSEFIHFSVYAASAGQALEETSNSESIPAAQLGLINDAIDETMKWLHGRPWNRNLLTTVEKIHSEADAAVRARHEFDE